MESECGGFLKTSTRLGETHLGSGPAEQSESKLADGRNHQVHSDGPPASAFASSVRRSFLLLAQLKDGETPLEAVHAGGGPSRAVLGLQVGVSGGFLVQQETLEDEVRDFNPDDLKEQHVLVDLSGHS